MRPGGRRRCARIITGVRNILCRVLIELGHLEIEHRLLPPEGYSMAIVAIDVGYDAHLAEVFSALQRAGACLRAEDRDVVGDTHIDGIVAFGASAMTVRTSTRVRPGRHEPVAAALRLLINDAFDRQCRGAPRKTLVGDAAVGRGG